MDRDYLKKNNKEGHIRTISAKFGKLSSHPVVKEMSFEITVDDATNTLTQVS